MRTKNFVGKRYLVKRDCVIENQYYGKGDIYIPSPQMSEVAFMVLLGKDFFESMPASTPQVDQGAVPRLRLGSSPTDPLAQHGLYPEGVPLR